MLRLIGLAVVVVAAFLVLAPSALAARGHVYLHETIGTPCTVPLEPCGAGELKEPEGVAVNEASGGVYVVDAGNHRVQVFHADRSFAFMFGSEVNKTAVETAGRESEENLCPAVGHPGDECQPGTPGASGAALEHPKTLAIDNACHLKEAETGNPLSASECEAFDPSNGAVYVEDAEEGFVPRIVKFGADGEFLGQITESEEGPFPGEVEGVTLDPQGTVWVIQQSRWVTRYANGAGNPISSEFRFKEPFPGFPRHGLTVDAEGNTYVRYSPQFRIAKVGPTGDTVIEQLDGEDSSAVAVDQLASTVLLDNLTSVAVFSTEGSSATELERLDFEGELGEGAGIGVDASSGFAYVADRAGGRLLVLAPTQPGPPTISGANQFVSEVSSGGAELHGEVDPQGEEGEAATTYSFQYGACPSLSICPSASATPTGTLPADFETHPVAAAITDLAPGTTYHYRLTATNSHSTEPTLGPEGAFTTQPIGSFLLPDSRQWQLVSPARKLGAKIEPIKEVGVIQAAAGGSALTYLASTPTEPEPAGFRAEQQLLSRRGPAGWSTHDLATPHTQPTGHGVGVSLEYMFFSSGLGTAALQPLGPFEPALSPQASESTAFLRDLGESCGSGCYRPLVTDAPGFANVPPGTEFGNDQACTPEGGGGTVCGPEFLGAADDLSHVLLHSATGLTANLADHGGLYEWSGGVLSQVSVLPDAEPSSEGVLGQETLGHQGESARRAISADGSRVVWSTPQALYLRYNATEPQSAISGGQCSEPSKACTIQLDAAEPLCPTCQSGGGVFQIASTDGSRVFFTDANKLTADSGADERDADLYECAIVAEAGHLACNLTDLTPPNGSEPAGVQGGVLGASTEGSDLYFVANGVLALNSVENGAGPQFAAPGNCGGTSASATCNLYRLHDGTITFVAPLTGADQHDWELALSSQPTRVSADGRFLAFLGQESLTGYDNRDASSGKPVGELYLYDASTGGMVCPSCDPSGARPDGVEYHSVLPTEGGLVGGQGNVWPRGALLAATLPGWTSNGRYSRYQDRYLSDSGRLFFNANGPLVPADSNGTFDVYQYEPPQGPGQPASNTCTTASATYSARNGGCVDLISAGTSGTESAFLDASESGDDVFFLTASRLQPRLDTDAALDVYDAHVCSASVPCLPEPPAPPPVCQGDACQQPAVPPNHPTPGTALLNGPGNLLQCPKGKVKKNGKCVKKHKAKKKHHKKKSKKQHKSKRSNGNRGGVK